ncbi:MAG: Flp pilus assembly protein CpaB [Rickettsiales bacterium]
MRFGGLIAAVVFAAIAAIVVMRMSGGSEPAPATGTPAQQNVATINIYVAAKAIPVGSTITEDMVASQPWPQHLALEGFINADGKTNVVGMVTRSSLQPNEPLMTAKMANPNDPNFLAGDLPKGMRVITIPINEVDGVAGFIFPGDHVDLVYTHDVDKWEYTPAQPSQNGDTAAPSAQKTKVTVTETVLTNVKVLAVDQRSSSIGAVDNNGNLVVPHSASLMVSQSDAQRVRLAQKTGTLSLVLRALADRESADPLVLTTRTDVSQSPDIGSADTGGQSEVGIKIVRGAPVSDKEVQSSNSTNKKPTTVTRGVVPSTALVPSAAPVTTAPATASAAPTAPAVVPAAALPPITNKVNPGLAAVP